MALGAGKGSDTICVAARKSEDSLCTCTLLLLEGTLPEAHCARPALAPDDTSWDVPAPVFAASHVGVSLCYDVSPREHLLHPLISRQLARYMAT